MHQDEVQDILQARKPHDYSEVVREPIYDFTYLITAAAWTLEEALNILATFKYSEECANNKISFDDAWEICHKILYSALKDYELENKTFIVKVLTDEPYNRIHKGLGIRLHESTLYPDKFVHWARENSLPIPENFYQKVIKASAIRPTLTNDDELLSLPAKEKRELGRLRREQENFDLAIKATVKAVTHCIEQGQRLKRDELYGLLSRDPDAISKELFERILPLLPKEFRKGPGAPGKKKEKSAEPK